MTTLSGPAAALSAATTVASQQARQEPPSARTTVAGQGDQTPQRSQTPTAPTAATFPPAVSVALSAQAQALTASATGSLTGTADQAGNGAVTRQLLDQRNEAASAANAIERGQESSRAQADAIDEALDELEKAFEALARLFGLKEDDARASAAKSRGAVDGSLDRSSIGGADATNGADVGFRIRTEQQLTIRVEELSVSVSREGPDGSSTVSATVRSVSIEFRETTSLEMLIAEQDPLILDLDGNGIDLAGIEGGKEFDMDGDGDRERTAWIAGQDAFLALDRNQNGVIDSGKELFGDQHGAKDGFEELRKFDDTGDGRIDKQDSVWSALLLLKADGTTQGLDEAGIASIRLDAIVPVDVRIGDAGRLAAQSHFERTDGRSGAVGELYLDVEV